MLKRQLGDHCCSMLSKSLNVVKIEPLFEIFHIFGFKRQIEKVVLFLLDQQGVLATRIAKLGEQQILLQQEPDISKIGELRESYRQVGRDILKLLFFIEINAIGLRKILKKFDKRFGYIFTNYYVKTCANHPYSQLQQVFKHVVICSAQNFYILFCTFTLCSCFSFQIILQLNKLLAGP